MIESLENLRAAKRDGSCVVVTLVAVRGSTPRETGSKLVVNSRDVAGALGGERLEAALVAHARDLLASAGPAESRAELITGFTGGCGGVADVLFELLPASLPAWFDALERSAREGVPAVLATVTGDGRKLLVGTQEAGAEPGDAFVAAIVARARRMLAEGTREPVVLQVDEPRNAPPVVLEPRAAPPFDVVIFGAGRVARPLVEILAHVRCRITWVGASDEAFPAAPPPNVTLVRTETPAAAVDDAPPDASFVVMTMAHELDYVLTRQILARDAFAYLGVIGSQTKRETFERRLRLRGVDEDRLARIACPIGIEGIRDKDPGAIAIAAAAQLLLVRARTAKAAAVR